LEQSAGGIWHTKPEVPWTQPVATAGQTTPPQVHWGPEGVAVQTVLAMTAGQLFAQVGGALVQKGAPVVLVQVWSAGQGPLEPQTHWVLVLPGM